MEDQFIFKRATEEEREELKKGLERIIWLDYVNECYWARRQGCNWVEKPTKEGFERWRKKRDELWKESVGKDKW